MSLPLIKEWCTHKDVESHKSCVGTQKDIPKLIKKISKLQMRGYKTDISTQNKMCMLLFRKMSKS